MIVAINFANENYRKAQKLNSKTAYINGASKVIEYSPSDISKEFKDTNKRIWNNTKGNGYWIWKPYIIKSTLQKMKNGDYLIYADSGAAYINKIKLLLSAMKKEATNFMFFEITQLERQYSKRDAFILLDCDTAEIVNSKQICGGYMILRKCIQVEEFVDEWLENVCDERIVTDNANQMGLPNYDGFVENRHDQTVLSLLAKKHNIRPFRDPSQFGNSEKGYSVGVVERSLYPQIFDSHRNGNITTLYVAYKFKIYEKIYMLMSKRGKKLS